MEFFNFSPDLKMRAYSGVVFVKYHRHLKALRRQDILQISKAGNDDIRCFLCQAIC